MADLLDSMAQTSKARLAEARVLNSEAELLRMARGAKAPLPLVFSPAGFDIVAEIKLRSPSEGALSQARGDRVRAAQDQARAYQAGGAMAISVLTEPIRFGGDIADIGTVKQAVDLPVLRKDFLVEPYQVLEARAHGADGVLLIARMLSVDSLTDMIATAHDTGMFVLLEGFDGEDLDRCAAVAAMLRDTDLVGINARNLRTLEVEKERFQQLIAKLPTTSRRIAESGLNTPADARSVASLGFDAALVGTSLMRSDDAATLLREMIDAGRSARGKT